MVGKSFPVRSSATMKRDPRRKRPSGWKKQPEKHKRKKNRVWKEWNGGTQQHVSYLQSSSDTWWPEGCRKWVVSPATTDVRLVSSFFVGVCTHAIGSRARGWCTCCPACAAGPWLLLARKSSRVQDTPKEKGPRGGGFRGSQAGERR